MKRSLAPLLVLCAALVLVCSNQSFAAQDVAALVPAEITLDSGVQQPEEEPLQLAWGRGCYRGYGGYRAYYGGYGPYQRGYGYYGGYGGYYGGYRAYSFYGGYGGYGYGGYRCW